MSLVQDAITWQDIVKLAVTTGVLTAAVNQLLVWWREQHTEQNRQRSDASYLGLRIAVILEKFAIDCVDRIGDNQMHRDSGGHAGRSYTTLPELPEYPDDLAWKSIDQDLAARALTFRNELTLSDSYLSFSWDVEPEDAPHACSLQCGRCGHLAWEVAVEIRKRYSLPAFEPSRAGWNIDSVLKEKHDKALKIVADD